MVKLFVAGSLSPKPEEWSKWDEISLILAEDEEQAKQFADCLPVLEVDMSKPGLLCFMPEPNMGEDL